jgi:ankyrin repeat protein
MNNLLSYCGLVDTRISASEKDLTVQQVKAITSLANGKGEDVLNDLLTFKMTYNSEVLDGWELMPNCRWILGGTTIHLATNWHIESLVHFLGLRQDDPKFCQKLINLTSEYGYTSLHVAAVQDNTVATRFLIDKKAKTGAQNDKKQTALHLAAHSGSINNVITLMYDGHAHLMDQDDKKDTPLHLAKTSKILNILLSKVKAQELVSIEESYEKSFFNWILQGIS